ncbi:3-oxoacyl-ACP synthase [Streptococcus dentasini]
MSNNRIGIKSYGVSIPYFRLPVEEVIGTWKNNSVDYIKNKIGIERRTVVSSDEDTLTLAMEAGQIAISNFKENIEKIDSILLGSCTTPDIFKSNANQLMSFLLSKHDYFGCDIRASENSGMASLALGYSLVKSGLSNNSLVFGSDTLSKNIFPSELREPYIGSGASSIILGKGEEVLAEIIGIGNSNDSFPEQGRTEDSRYLRVLANLNHSVVKEGEIKRSIESIGNALNDASLKANDINYFAFQENIGQTYTEISNFFKFDNSINQEVLKDIGYLGSASPIIAMLLALENAKVGDTILMCGYGHSSGSTTIIFRVNRKVNFKNRIIDTLKSYREISYSEAMKYEFKYSQPEISLGTFI